MILLKCTKVFGAIAALGVLSMTVPAAAQTTYGVCGVKVWIYKGDILAHDPMAVDKRAMEQQQSR